MKRNNVVGIVGCVLVCSTVNAWNFPAFVAMAFGSSNKQHSFQPQPPGGISVYTVTPVVYDLSMYVYTESDVEELRTLRDKNIKVVCDRYRWEGDGDEYKGLQELYNETNLIIAKRESRLGDEKSVPDLKIEANRVKSLCALSANLVNVFKKNNWGPKDIARIQEMNASICQYWKQQDSKYKEAAGIYQYDGGQ